MAAIGTLCYLKEAKYKADKALIAANFNGIKVELKEMSLAECLDEKALPTNPVRKVPCLLVDDACVFTSIAVARYIARCRGDTNLYGQTFDDESIIDTWLDFGTHEVEVPLMTWVYPTMGFMEHDAQCVQQAQKDVKRALSTMESQLAATQYLLGDYVSLADVCLVCSLKEAFVRVFDPAFRKGYPKVIAWFEACVAMGQFKKVLGEVTLCQVAEKPKPVLEVPKPKPEEGKGKKEAKASPKAKAAAAPTPVAPVAGGGDEAAIKACGDEIRALKDKLKGEGLSGGKINNHADVKALVDKLTQLKSGAAPAPAATPAKQSPKASPKKAAEAAPAAAGGANEAAIKACGDEVRALKEKLKAEGLSGKKINEHADIKALVGKLTALKAGGPAPAAAAAPAPAAAAAPAPAAGDVDGEITAVGDQIRQLKEKLKSDGLSGKKVNDHAEVKALVAKLQELKAKK